jgi:hypothetical protein
MSDTSRRGIDRASRLARAAALSGTSAKVCPADRATRLLEAIIEPGDRVTIEGDNQKQADFLASTLAKMDPARVHDLHMVQSVLAPPVDPVARFHLGNGARLERINWLGNAARRAIQESFGIMVNYLYDHDSIEDNHEVFVRNGAIVRSPDVDTLLEA